MIKNYNDKPWNNLQTNYGIALNGKTLEFLYNNREKYERTLIEILSKAKVYARMSPDHKGLLVSLIQDNLMTRVGMCGDGANDCVALKQADAGISLSDAEASIAAPFTSKINTIECVELTPTGSRLGTCLMSDGVY